MSIRFIYGRAGSGKSYFCIEDIKAMVEQKSEKPLIYLIPEQFSFQAEKNILNTIGEKSNLNVKVLSFKRMAYRIMNEVGGITHKHMDSAGKCMLISHVLDEVIDDLTVFKRAATQKGFINTISDSISEFKRYSITPEFLGETALGMENDINLRSKLLDLSKIYGNFEELLHKNYIDADDDLLILNEKLDESKMFNNSEIWIDEFSSFTPQQYMIIEKIIRKAKRVNISLTSDYEDGRDYGTDIFQFTRNTENKLLDIARDNNVVIDKPVVLNKRPFYRFQASKSLACLEQNLFAYPNKVYTEESDDIVLFRAQNTYSEVESTARDIIRLCRDKGYRYRDIAVITRDLKNYENVIAAVFNEHGIDYFIDEKRDIEGNLIVVLITSAIEVINKNWSYEAMFRYLKTGLTNIPSEDIDVFENYVLAAGIRGKKKWLDAEKWDYRPDAFLGSDEISLKDAKLLAKINLIREAVVEPLRKFYYNTRGSKSAEETCKILFEFLIDIGAENKVEDLVSKFKESERQELANEYSQIWNIIMDLLDQTVEVMGDMKLSLEDFEKILTIGVKEHKMGLIPPSVDQVLVGSVERLKSHDICALYLVGVNDGVFPSTKNEEGILSDVDRMSLKDRGIELAKDTRTAAFEEQFLVYTTLTIPRKYLRISYPMADYEGKTLRTSAIVSRIKNIFENVKEESDINFNEDDNDRLMLIDAKIPTFNQLINVMRRRIDGENDAVIWRDVYKWFSNSKQWREKCQRAFSGSTYSNQSKLIEREKAKQLYGENMRINVSRLEKYAECPFAYYVQYGLNAKERKVFKLSYPDIGTFMHKIIDEFSEKVNTDGLNWNEIDNLWCENSINKIVEDNVSSSNSYILSSSPRYKYLTGRLKRVLTRTAMVIANHIRRSGFKPVGFEIDFSETGGYPPIIVELASGEKINLIGRIDRIDMLIKEGETYIRIIDYKSGNKVFKLSDVYYGLQVQLLLYLDAILMEEGKDAVKEPLPGAILYFKIDDPIIRKNKDLNDEELKIEIMKKFRMNGLLIDEPDIIKEMDIEMDGNSVVIPARINKDGSLGKSDVASKKQFEILRDHVKNVIVKNCENMLNGDISINPCKNKEFVTCSFCLYSSICAFDPTLEDNNYRNIYDKSDDEVWSILNKKYTEQEGEE